MKGKSNKGNALSKPLILLGFLRLHVRTMQNSISFKVDILMPYCIYM